jgi:hypothetical protein
LWREKLPRPEGAAGDRLRHRFRLPPRVAAQAAAAGDLRVRIRPESEADNAVTANDTVALTRKGKRSRHQIFVRPLRSLEERGFLDALYAAESLAVSSSPPESLASLNLGSGDVLWIRARSPSQARALESAAKAGVPAVLYGETGAQAYSADARVGIQPEGIAHLPAGVVRLADLGAESLTLAPEDSSVEAMAWAEERGRRGVLLGRRRGGMIFTLAALPFWSSAFRPNADDRVLGLQRHWARGAAAWVGRRGRGVWVEMPERLVADRPFFVKAFFSAMAAAPDSGSPVLRGDGLSVGGEPLGGGEFRFGPIRLPAGRNVLSISVGASGLWSDTALVRHPLDVELSLLGVDAEGLARLAAETFGTAHVLTADSANAGIFVPSLPELPRGQMRAERSQTKPFLPQFWMALLTAALFCTAWALRKKFRLD